MIRDVVIHMNSEQPMMADLKTLPTARDACLVCTNLRMVDGRKPTFIDRIDSWFLIPLGIVRFVELPGSAMSGVEGSTFLALPSGPIDDDGEDDFDPEEDLLRRIREA